MARQIVGLDSGGRRLALYFLEEERFLLYEVGESRTEEELGGLKFWLHDVAGIRHSTHDVWLETNMVGVAGNVQTSLRHAMTIGMVLATVGGTLISPTTWKASILGHGSADADAYTAWVEATCPQVAEVVRCDTTRKQQRQDSYAAYCIAQHGHLARRHPDQLVPRRRVSKRTSRA